MTLRTLHRCKRPGRQCFGLFCHQHRFYPWVLLFTVVLPLVGLAKEFWPNHSANRIVSARELEEIQRVSEFFSGRNEVLLRTAFGFDDVIKRSVGWLYAWNEHKVRRAPYDPSSFVRKEDELVVLRVTRDTEDLSEGHAGLFATGPTVVLTQAYREVRDSLARFADSPFLHQDTRQLILEFIELEQRNTGILWRVLLEGRTVLPARYRGPDAQLAWEIWVGNKFINEQEAFTPKADAIRLNLQNYGTSGSPAGP